MGDENSNRNRTLGDYSRPSHEGYRKVIKLPEGAKVSPLRSDTIRLVQNGCAFHGLMSEDPIQHLKDFLKIVDSIDLNGATRNTTRLRLFCFTLRDQAINWLDRLPAGSISTWDDLPTRFLAQFFLPKRTAKYRNDILISNNIKRRPQTAPVRRVEALLVDDSRRRGRPKLRWEDRLKQYMKDLILSEDMTFDRNAWRDRIRISG
ncbi:zinc finger, CCHC-type containing protein [Tanacetum coccineum]